MPTSIQKSPRTEGECRSVCTVLQDCAAHPEIHSAKKIKALNSYYYNIKDNMMCPKLLFPFTLCFFIFHVCVFGVRWVPTYRKHRQSRLRTTFWSWFTLPFWGIGMGLTNLKHAPSATVPSCQTLLVLLRNQFQMIAVLKIRTENLSN